MDRSVTALELRGGLVADVTAGCGPMTGPRHAALVWMPEWQPAVWRADPQDLRYGLEIFYSRGGDVTHYWNWYDRTMSVRSDDDHATTEPGGMGFALAYIRTTTRNSMENYRVGAISLPDPAS